MRKRSYNVATATNVFCSESEASATNVLSVRKRSDSNNVLSVAKAKRQLQSAQSERKSTPRYDGVRIYKIFSFSGIIEGKRWKRSL
ncbi:hypothetical protein [Lysinibacillus sp. BPa_S21]|uniref:hypothetical protein n=1 Tax=Lysinibacillus sp. BPa_S21 TaxID=2932478 RepID=UPI002010EF8F|nr:hypothetical protein [Lysinibacillus sp. BPa_S21]MCL1695723.1 hypothetical protein [Lysinibacillus sp. BPa_S21]